MGKIRRNVNWTTSLDGDDGFWVVGNKNPYIVHATSTESARQTDVLFEQCEDGGDSDVCYINQSGTVSYVFQYYDYGADTTLFSRNATVRFETSDGSFLSDEVTDENGVCTLKVQSGLYDKVNAYVLREQQFNESFEISVDKEWEYQTPIDVIREAMPSKTYNASINAFVDTIYDYDNNESVTIESGSSNSISMLRKSDDARGHISVISGESGNVSYSYQNHQIRFNRTVNETREEEEFPDSVAIFYYDTTGDTGAKTVTFKGPKRAKVNYSTTYKVIETDENVSAVTDTTYEESAITMSNMYNTDVFTYMSERPTQPDDKRVGLDIIAYDGNNSQSGIVETFIDTKKFDNYYADASWTSATSTTLQIMSNDEDSFDNLTASLHVGNKEIWEHNEKRTFSTTKGGSTQFRIADLDNAAWAADPSNGVVIDNHNHPGFLRVTENPSTHLKVAQITYDPGEVPPVVSSGITRDSNWSYMYMGSGSNQTSEPTTKYRLTPIEYATWIVIDSGDTEYSLSHSRGISFISHPQDSLVPIESSATTLFNRINDADYRVDGFDSVTTVVYPQFGSMSYRDQKYILFFSPNKRHVAIISRDTEPTSGGHLESSVFNSELTRINKTLVNATSGKTNEITYLSGCNESVLFNISNDKVEYTDVWNLSDEQANYDINNNSGVDTSGYQWSVIMNQAKSVIEASTISASTLGEDLFDSGATEIYGYLYDFDVSDENSGVTKTKLSESTITEGVYTASTSFYRREELTGYWSINRGDELPAGNEFFVSDEHDWIDISPILITDDADDFSGLTTVTIRNTERPIQTSYQLYGENGLIRIVSRTFKKQLDDVEYWHGFILKPEENNSQNPRCLHFETVQRDRYHFNKETLTRYIQDEYDPGYAPKVWINDMYGRPGELPRNNSFFEVIQTGSGDTMEDVYDELFNFMDNKIRTDERYKQVYTGVTTYDEEGRPKAPTGGIKQIGGTVVAIFLEKDNKITIDSDAGKANNPYNIGPWKYDFVNAVYAPYDEQLYVELASDSATTGVEINFVKGTNVKGTLQYSYTRGNNSWIDITAKKPVLPFVESASRKYKKVYFRGSLSGGTNGVGRFVLTKLSGTAGTPVCNVGNNPMSLSYSSNVIFHDSFNHSGDTDYMFASLFSGNTFIDDASKLYLLRDTRRGCFKNMFAGCTNLKVGPRLIAWNLVDECYSGMFSGCTSLTDLYCMAKDTPPTSSVSNWLSGVSGLTFVKNKQATWQNSGMNLPEGTTVITLDDGRS